MEGWIDINYRKPVPGDGPVSIVGNFGESMMVPFLDRFLALNPMVTTENITHWKPMATTNKPQPPCQPGADN